MSNAYAMSTLVTFEPLVDTTTVAFLEQLKKRFAGRSDGEGTCDFGVWLQYYAFDVIGELTYSKRLGFVDRGVDVDHIIGNLERLLNYVSVVRVQRSQALMKSAKIDTRSDNCQYWTEYCSRTPSGYG